MIIWGIWGIFGAGKEVIFYFFYLAITVSNLPQSEALGQIVIHA